MTRRKPGCRMIQDSRRSLDLQERPGHGRLLTNRDPAPLPVVAKLAELVHLNDHRDWFT